MSISESLNKDPYYDCTIGKGTSFGFSLKVMNICCERFLLLILNFHKVTTEGWILELQSFKQSKSVIPSQHLPELIASVI